MMRKKGMNSAAKTGDEGCYSGERTICDCSVIDRDEHNVFRNSEKIPKGRLK